MAVSLLLIYSSRSDHFHYAFLSSVFLRETEIDSSELKHEGMKILLYSHSLTCSQFDAQVAVQ